MNTTRVIKSILTLCEAHPEAPVLVERSPFFDGRRPLIMVLTTSQQVSAFLREGVLRFIQGVALGTPLNGLDLALRIGNNVHLPVTVHTEDQILDFDVAARVTVHRARFDDGCIILDTAPSALSALRRLAAENPAARILYSDPWAELSHPVYRPITAAVSGAFKRPDQLAHAPFAFALFADPTQPIATAEVVLRTIEMEVGDRDDVPLMIDWPLGGDAIKIDSNLETIGNVRLLDSDTIVIEPAFEIEDVPLLTPSCPSLKVGDRIQGGPGWAFGQSLDAHIYVSDVPQQHQDFAFHRLAVQGFRPQRNALLKGGIASLYEKVSPNTAYDATRPDAVFEVVLVSLLRDGHITHLEGVSEIRQPGDAYLVDAGRLGVDGRIPPGAEYIRFVMAGHLSGNDYAMRAAPRLVPMQTEDQ